MYNVQFRYLTVNYKVNSFFQTKKNEKWKYINWIDWLKTENQKKKQKILQFLATTIGTWERQNILSPNEKKIEFEIYVRNVFFDCLGDLNKFAINNKNTAEKNTEIWQSFCCCCLPESLDKFNDLPMNILAIWTKPEKNSNFNFG